jgi:hypothetical protein
MAIADSEVLAFAATESRILLSYNRRHFLLLHRHRTQTHAGIVLFTVDPDFIGQARRIHDAIARFADFTDQVVRINRPE